MSNCYCQQRGASSESHHGWTSGLYGAGVRSFITLCRNWVSCIQSSPSEDQLIELSSLTVRKTKSSETQNLFNKQHKTEISCQQTAAAVVDSQDKHQLLNHFSRGETRPIFETHSQLITYSGYRMAANLIYSPKASVLFFFFLSLE